MRIKIPLLLSCLSLSQLMFGQSLTLSECLTRAIETSKAIEIAECHTLRAVGEKNAVGSNLLPHVSIEGVIDNSNKALDWNLNQFQNFKSTKAIGFSAIMGLYDFGATWKRFKASKLRIDASEWERANVILQVEAIVMSAYYSVLEKERALEIAERSLERLRLQMKRTEGLLEQGQLKQSDLLAVRVQLSEKEKERLHAQHQLTTQRMNLNRLIGFPLDAICDLQDQVWKWIAVDCEKAVAFALCARPDLLAFRAQLQALYKDYQAVGLDMAPKFFVFANGNLPYEHDRSFSTGIGMKMPLYQGGLNLSTRQILRAQICELEALIEDAEANANLEIRELCLRFIELEQQEALSCHSLALAEQNYADFLNLYQQGMASIHDLLFAEEQLSFAKLALVSNNYQKYYALARFRNITGGYQNYDEKLLDPSSICRNSVVGVAGLQ